jgi:hypothetical protein
MPDKELRWINALLGMLSRDVMDLPGILIFAIAGQDSSRWQLPGR